MLALEHVAARDVLPDTVDLLIDDRLPLANRPHGHLQHEVPLSIHLEPVGALDVEDDAGGVSARAHNEVILELALIAVIEEIDARIKVRVAHLRVGRDVGAPLRGIVADEVVGLAGEFLQPRHARTRVGAGEADAQRGPGRCPSRLRFAVCGWLACG